MATPNERDREVRGRVSYELRQGNVGKAESIIADYREECERAERGRVLAELEALTSGRSLLTSKDLHEFIHRKRFEPPHAPGRAVELRCVVSRLRGEP